MGIHTEHPFMAAPEERDPVRRFRGRLVAPVTIVTAGDTDRRALLTISSLIVVEGEPGIVLAAVSPTTDLWDVVASTGRFVVHMCTERQRELADVFAGIRPDPGSVLAGSEVTLSGWGPILASLQDRLYCTLLGREEVGWSGLFRGRIDRVELGSSAEPLVHFRGRYRRLA